MISSFGREYSHEVAENVLLTQHLIGKGWKIEATWMPGHQGFEPNEMADKLAKEAAQSAQNIHFPCNRKIILNQLKENVKRNWQFRYEINCGDHRLFSICEKVDKWFSPNIPGIRHLFQLVSGHNKLNSCQVRYNPDILDDKCMCGSRETSDHFMYECERYSLHRFNLCRELNLILDVNFSRLEHFGWKNILGQNEQHTYETRSRILKEVIQFIVLSKRFV